MHRFAVLNKNIVQSKAVQADWAVLPPWSHFHSGCRGESLWVICTSELWFVRENTKLMMYKLASELFEEMRRMFYNFAVTSWNSQGGRCHCRAFPEFRTDFKLFHRPSSFICRCFDKRKWFISKTHSNENQDSMWRYNHVHLQIIVFKVRISLSGILKVTVISCLHPRVDVLEFAWATGRDWAE